MPGTINDLRGIGAVLCPNFVSDPRFEAAVAIARKHIDPEHCFHDEVVVLLAAHLITLGKTGGTPGQVVSKSEGSVSISYAQGSSNGGLSSTSYGQEIERLNALCYGGFSARTAWLVEIEG